MTEAPPPRAPAAPPALAFKRGTLAAILGSAAAAAGLLVATPLEESGRTVTAAVAADGTATVRHVAGPRYLASYLDIAGIPTACDGITPGIRMGQVYSDAQCNALLERELVGHAAKVVACVPKLYGREHQATASVLLAYNIGTGAFCASTAARRFRAGLWAEGCDAFLMWNKARVGGRLQVVRGLQLRRGRERAECLKGLRR